MQFLLFALLLPFLTLAQTEQPLKESAADLRTGINMFIIEDLNEENTIWLERTSNLDYLLRMRNNDDKMWNEKVPTKDALKLDREFAAKFLKMQYELPASEEGCKIMFRLTMKGEEQSVCKKDDKKSQEMIPFMRELAKRLDK